MFCRYLDITKVVDLNVKTVFSRRNCSYREKIPHLVNVSGEYYGVRASGWYLHHKVTNFLQQIWTLSLHWERGASPRKLNLTTRDYTWLHRPDSLLLKCRTLMCKSSITDRHRAISVWVSPWSKVKPNTIIHDAAMMLRWCCFYSIFSYRIHREN